MLKSADDLRSSESEETDKLLFEQPDLITDSNLSPTHQITSHSPNLNSPMTQTQSISFANTSDQVFVSQEGENLDSKIETELEQRSLLDKKSQPQQSGNFHINTDSRHGLLD